MSYKAPRYIYFYLLFGIFFVTLSYFSSVESNERNLGQFNVSKSANTKLELDIKNVSILNIQIDDIHITNNESLCKTGDIYIYGTLRNKPIIMGKLRCFHSFNYCIQILFKRRYKWRNGPDCPFGWKGIKQILNSWENRFNLFFLGIRY